MILAFTNHWRQCDTATRQELWQTERIFDMTRRLETWRQRDEKWDYERTAKNGLQKAL